MPAAACACTIICHDLRVCFAEIYYTKQAEAQVEFMQTNKLPRTLFLPRARSSQDREGEEEKKTDGIPSA